MMSQSKRVALFVTCLVDQALPEIGVATLRLLRRAGYSVDFPEEQTCCGQPFLNSGFRRQAVDLAKRTVEIFEKYEAVVLPGGSCTATVVTDYPSLLAEWPDWRSRAQELAGKTYELSQFLVNQAQWKPTAVSPARKVTYHDSCHMNRRLHLQKEPRQLLESAGCQVYEMMESDRCCGFGGIFCVRMPEVSNAMTAEKLRQAVDTDANVLVTADPGCLIQMRGLAQGISLRVEHIATILEELTR